VRGGTIIIVAYPVREELASVTNRGTGEIISKLEQHDGEGCALLVASMWCHSSGGCSQYINLKKESAGAHV